MKERPILFAFSSGCSHPLIRVLLDASESSPGRYTVRKVRQACYTPAARHAVAMHQLLAVKQRNLNKFNEAYLLSRWDSRPIWRNNGWYLDQRFGRKLRRLVAA
jgi:hypothetical protein